MLYDRVLSSLWSLLARIGISLSVIWFKNVLRVHKLVQDILWSDKKKGKWKGNKISDLFSCSTQMDLILIFMEYWNEAQYYWISSLCFEFLC